MRKILWAQSGHQQVWHRVKNDQWRGPNEYNPLELSPVRAVDGCLSDEGPNKGQPMILSRLIVRKKPGPRTAICPVCRETLNSFEQEELYRLQHPHQENAPVPPKIRLSPAAKKSIKDGESKRHKFVRVAEPRVRQIIKKIQILEAIGRGSNRHNYEYCAEDVEMINEAVGAALAACIATLMPKEDEEGKFSFFPAVGMRD